MTYPFSETFWSNKSGTLVKFFHSVFLKIEGINDYSFKIKEIIDQLKNQNFDDLNLSHEQKRKLFFKYLGELKIAQENHFKLMTASHDSLMKQHFSFAGQFCEQFNSNILLDALDEKDAEEISVIIILYYSFLTKIELVLNFIKDDFILNNVQIIDLLEEFFKTFEKKNLESINREGFIAYNYPIFLSKDFEYFIQAKKEFFSQENANEALLNLKIEKNNSKFIHKINTKLVEQKEEFIRIIETALPDSFSIVQPKLNEFFEKELADSYSIGQPKSSEFFEEEKI